MDLRTRRSLAAVGGLTAVATATGALATVVHVAPAGAGPDSAGAALGAANLAGAAIGPCSAFFGFGKEEGVLGVVDFDVVDNNGDDGAAHDVDDDTNVVLVLENEGGETIECVPDELTADTWNDEFGEDPLLPAFPGEGHFAYPSVNLHPEIEELGEIVAVGFRVTDIPPSEHTLVSPTGVKELDPIFVDPEEAFEGTLIDGRVIDFVAAEASAAAADDYEAFLLACDGEPQPDPSTDPDLLAAIHALEAVIDETPSTFTEVDCFDADFAHVQAGLVLGVFASVEYVEVIQLELPDAPPADPPAAQPAQETPDFTG